MFCLFLLFKDNLSDANIYTYFVECDLGIFEILSGVTEEKIHQNNCVSVPKAYFFYQRLFIHVSFTALRWTQILLKYLHGNMPQLK